MATDYIEDLLNTLVHHVTEGELFKLVSSEVKFSVKLLLRQSERSVRSSSNTSDNYEDALFKIQSVLDNTWEALNTGQWNNVPLYLRHLYTIASFIKIAAMIQVERGKPVPNYPDLIKRALKTADMGLLLGAPLSCGLCLTKVAQALTSALTAFQASNQEEKVECNWNSTRDEWSAEHFPQRVKGKPVPRLQRPSIETFRVKHFQPETPVILADCISHWPALSRWQDCNYLRRIAGDRLVPVELGAKYTDQSWSQRLMTVTEFIDIHVRGTSGTPEVTGYLAQHPLFDQVPELLADIREPEYCCVSVGEEEEEPTAINAWFGPAGTVSPLHFDPKHNLLSQVVGWKRVYLYPPDDSQFLYPHMDRLLSNTSGVDPECPDYREHPLLREATAWECGLQPGEMLYIPPRWWHHIRATSISFSVSFWWR